MWPVSLTSFVCLSWETSVKMQTQRCLQNLVLKAVLHIQFLSNLWSCETFSLALAVGTLCQQLPAIIWLCSFVFKHFLSKYSNFKRPKIIGHKLKLSLHHQYFSQIFCTQCLLKSVTLRLQDTFCIWLGDSLPGFTKVIFTACLFWGHFTSLQSSAS